MALSGRALSKMADKTSAFAEEAVEAHRRHRRLQESDGMQEAIDLLLTQEEKTQRAERARVVRRMYAELERLQLLERARRNASGARGRRARESFARFGHKTKDREVETPHIGGRRLLKTGGPAEFPDWYVQRYGWVATAVDWRFWYQEAQRVANADARRMHWWSSGAEGDIPEHARTGYRLLDMRVPPTVLGRAMRKLGLRVSNRTAHWEADERRRRTLQSAVWHPNPLDSGRKLRDMFYDPQSWANVDPTADGLVRFLESRDHRTRARRLSEYGAQQAEHYAQGVATVATSAAGVAGSFFESPIRAPTYQSPLAGKNMRSARRNPTNTIDTVIRYFLFNVALCYLYPEDEKDANSQFQSDQGNEMPDGTGVKTHGTSRLCFPARKLCYVQTCQPFLCCALNGEPLCLQFPFCSRRCPPGRSSPAQRTWTWPASPTTTRATRAACAARST